LLGSRNLLVEGGDKLTKSFLNDKIFNKFYLFKSPNNLSKKTEFVQFKSLNTLKSKYRYKLKTNLKLKKDKIELYKNYV
jgi:diaminohydroxyphosphoribosylaminopyrimidine deaminase/5-amino-6-(5-phosphoribosylamino)uracil reductase